MKRSELKRKTGLARGKGLARSALPKKPAHPVSAAPVQPKRKPLARRSRRKLGADGRAGEEMIRALRSRWYCAICGAGRTRPAYQLDPHHCLPQQRIRAHVRSLRLPEEEAQKLASLLLHDPVNVAVLCRECHERVEGNHRMLPRGAMPAGCWTWVLEHFGDREVAWMERTYPA